MKLDSTSKLAGLLAQIQFFGLGDDYIERYAERVRAVTLDDVRNAARKHLDPDALVEVVVGPAAELQKQGIGGAPTAKPTTGKPGEPAPPGALPPGHGPGA